MRSKWKEYVPERRFYFNYVKTTQNKKIEKEKDIKPILFLTILAKNNL